MNLNQLLGKKPRHFLALLPAIVLAAVTTAAVADNRDHDDDSDLDRGKKPLVIKKQGSFFVGGETRFTNATTGTPGGFVYPNEDYIQVNQMYVQYQVPLANRGRVPIVMLHGCCLSGKTYETTPDGRMGWDEYFLRKGHAVYLPDQVSRARSGFDATTINQVRLGMQPASALPNIFTFGRNAAWELFRFGTAYPSVFAGQQFPVDQIVDFGNQVIPDLNATLDPLDNPTWTNLATLGMKLDGAVLMGHSESGFFPEQAALKNPAGIKGMISIEGQCVSNLTPQQLATLAPIPTLVIFGDYLGDVPSSAGLWLSALDGCQQFVDQLNSAGGNATMLHLPAVGVHGNSHMLMQDKNNLQVADLILKWIDQHVKGKRGK